MTEPTTETDDLSGALAVVGLAGRFPGADTVTELWRNLRDGVESITVTTREELAEAGLPRAVYEHPDYVPAKGKLPGIDLFDADFFGFSAHEAELTDPQHRLFLECAWAAMEDAAHDPARFPGRVGVYAGQSMNTYVLWRAMRDPSVVASYYLDYMPMMVNANDDFLATRVAYHLDLTGPAMTVQTACSTSLVAVHQAAQGLLNGECDLALAGGVALLVPEGFGHVWRDGSGVSRDGHCRAFDSRGDGIVGGSGLGIVVLRRLADALDDGDVIHAVLRGSAVNNDGAGKAGFTAGSADGQAQAVADALAVAGVPAGSIGLVEAHGTATELGDPVEVAGLTRAFRAGTDRVGYCALGSLKTNLGHLAAAAGVTGLVKAVLAVRDGVIPATLHFREPNPKLDLPSSPFYVNNELVGWPEELAPRRAGVSALGVGGTNAHVVLEQPPASRPAGASRPWQLLTVSGRSASVADRAAAQLAGALDAGAGPLPDVAYTLAVGRRDFDHRRAVVCRDAAGGAAGLRAAAEPAEPARTRPVAFLFPGGGSQYPGMGRALYGAEPVFRAEVDRCAELAAPHLGADVRDALDPDRGAALLSTAAGMLTALFTVDYALARLWASWGVRPRAMLGHSLGEYVAACLAGVFTLPDALATVVLRGRLMDEAPAGTMLAVALPEADLTPLLGAELSLAAVNAPGQCTVAGPNDAVAELAGRLAERGVDTRALHVGRAAHSAALDPALDRFAAHLAGLTLHPPRERFLSNVTGDWITPEQATDPAYWVAQLRGTVRFADAVRLLLETPNVALVEVGPGTALGSLVTANLPAAGPRPPQAPSLPHPRDPQPEQAFLLGSLGRLWTSGVEVDWPALWSGERRNRVQLPTYPFERRRYWADGRTAGSAEEPAPAARELGRELDLGPAVHRRPDLLTSYVEPAGEVERAVTECWQALLGFDRIGAQDNFYALGGSSLLTARLVARLRERFGPGVPLDRLLVADTIADQARIVRECAPVEEEDGVG